MTPAAIIKKAMADGVNLALSPAGTIKATGEGAAVNRWLPVIRKYKPGIVAALQEAASELLPNSAAEARRQCVLAMLVERPGIRYAVVVDNPDTDPAIPALAIRGAMQDGSIMACELRVPRDKYDPFLLLDLIERHGATVH
jgi:hypothetical protein